MALEVLRTQYKRLLNSIHFILSILFKLNIFLFQDAYLSGLMDSESNSVLALNTLLSAPSSHQVSTPWILECKDVEKLENFIKECEKLVEMQMKIEQYQRNSELVLQEMQEEVWRVSTDPFSRNGQTFGPASAAAAFMLGVLNDEDEDFSDDETRHEALSVTNCEEDSNRKQISNKNEKKSASESLDCEANEKKGSTKPHPLELEKSRTELEASLYLSLRLNAEIEEVNHTLTTSEHLIQVDGFVICYVESGGNKLVNEEFASSFPCHIWNTTLTYLLLVKMRSLDHDNFRKICVVWSLY